MLAILERYLAKFSKGGKQDLIDEDFGLDLTGAPAPAALRLRRRLSSHISLELRVEL